MTSVSDRTELIVCGKPPSIVYVSVRAVVAQPVQARRSRAVALAELVRRDVQLGAVPQRVRACRVALVQARAGPRPDVGVEVELPDVEVTRPDVVQAAPPEAVVVPELGFGLGTARRRSGAHAAHVLEAHIAGIGGDRGRQDEQQTEGQHHQDDPQRVTECGGRQRPSQRRGHGGEHRHEQRIPLCGRRSPSVPPATGRLYGQRSDTASPRAAGHGRMIGVPRGPDTREAFDTWCLDAHPRSPGSTIRVARDRHRGLLYPRSAHARNEQGADGRRPTYECPGRRSTRTPTRQRPVRRGDGRARCGTHPLGPPAAAR